MVILANYLQDQLSTVPKQPDAANKLEFTKVNITNSYQELKDLEWKYQQQVFKVALLNEKSNKMSNDFSFVI